MLSKCYRLIKSFLFKRYANKHIMVIYGIKSIKTMYFPTGTHKMKAINLIIIMSKKL